MNDDPYTLDDLDIDIIDLRGLIDATYAIVHEMPFVRDGMRDEDLDRVASLLRIAQQFAKQIDDNIQVVGPRLGTSWRNQRKYQEAAE